MNPFPYIMWKLNKNFYENLELKQINTLLTKTEMELIIIFFVGKNLKDWINNNNYYYY